MKTEETISLKKLHLTDSDMDMCNPLTYLQAMRCRGVFMRFFVKGGKPIYPRLFEKSMEKLQDAQGLQLILPHGNDYEKKGKTYAATKSVAAH